MTKWLKELYSSKFILYYKINFILIIFAMSINVKILIKVIQEYQPVI